MGEKGNTEADRWLFWDKKLNSVAYYLLLGEQLSMGERLAAHVHIAAASQLGSNSWWKRMLLFSSIENHGWQPEATAFDASFKCKISICYTSCRGQFYQRREFSA